jgi:hypothetical protein
VSAVGRAVLRAAPWPVVLGGCAAAAVLFGIAGATRHSGVFLPMSLLGLGLCGAAAAYSLDEQSAEIEDATPTGRPVRIAWRVSIAVVPCAAGATAVLLLDNLGGATGWNRLAPVAAGSVAVGIAVASALRRTGRSAPGDLAGAITFGAVVLTVAIDPLHAWASLAPLGAPGYPLSSAVAWALVVVGSAAALVACERDPGSPRCPSASRWTVSPPGGSRRRRSPPSG